MRVLVTGANGQLGQSLRSIIPSEARDLSFLFTDIEELDITDLEAVRKMTREEGIDAIVNCAAYTNVDAAEDNQPMAEKLNAAAVENLAVAMKEVDGLLVHISTDYVFDGTATEPIPEDAPVHPVSVYGLTKLHGEQAIQRVGCRHIIIRTAWLYSEYGKNFVKTLLRLTAEKPTLKVVDDQRGTPTYAGDLAAVIAKILSFSPTIATPTRNVFHYTNEGECTWYEFACEIARLAGHTACNIQPCSSEEFPSKVHRPAYSVLDKSKIKGTLNISIPHWTDSLKKCLQGLL